MHTAKCFFAECQNKGTRQNTSLLSARKTALGKDAFCRVPKNSTRQNTYLSSTRKRHSAKTHFAVCRKITLGKDAFCRVFFLPSVFYLALGKDRLCRVPDKIHSAKPPALGKVLVSGSEMPMSRPYKTYL